jgi:hypothetical protein
MGVIKMRKAGIILGIVFIIVAIVVLIIGNKVTRDKGNVSENPVVEQEEIKNEDKKGNITDDDEKIEEKEEENKPVLEQNLQPAVKEVVTQVIDKDNTSVKTINSTALGDSSEIKEVISVISNKRILLIDEQIDAKDRKMLTYVFDVMTPDNSKMVVFVTKSVYDTFNVNDRLKVNYVTYKNDIGVEFPLVNFVSAVE